jgi:hypothetical protein
MSEPQLDTASFLRRIHESNARVVLIGGMAAIAQGVPYLTQDIDPRYAGRGAGPERPAPLPAPVVPISPLVPRTTLRSAQKPLPKQILRVPDDTCASLGGELYRAPRLCTACRAFGIG